MKKHILVSSLVGLASTAVFAAPGDVKLEPATITVNPGQSFSLQVLVDSGTQKLGGYTLELNYNRNLVQIDTTVPNGANALGTTNINKVDNDTGTVRLTGLDVNGIGPGGMLHILTINGMVLEDAQRGTAPVELKVESLINEMSDTIGTPSGHGSTINVASVFHTK
jgi:hypothetical protein